MKLRTLIAPAAALAVAAGVAAVIAPAATASPAQDTTIHQLQALMDQDVQAGAPGVVVRIADGDRSVRIARQAAWTTADHSLSADDEFRMASNTKVMVATVVLQLVAEHRLSLTDTVQKWLPGAVPNGSDITVRMLLDHTSGLADYIYDPDVIHTSTGQDQHAWTPEQLLAFGVGLGPMSAPGAQFNYSNTNYVALGLILQRVTHQSVADLVTQRIIRPLGLRDSYFAASGVSRDGDRLAHGYEPDPAHVASVLPPGTPAGTFFVGPERSGHVDTTANTPSYLWAAGAMVATPQDWQRFLTALQSGKLLPAAQLAQMHDTVPEPLSSGTARYGLGLEEYLSPCGAVWGHTGGIPGYASENYTNADGTASVTVVTTTLFGLHAPTLGAADQKVVNAAVCTMLHKPIPTS